MLLSTHQEKHTPGSLQRSYISKGGTKQVQLQVYILQNLRHLKYNFNTNVHFSLKENCFRLMFKVLGFIMGFMLVGPCTLFSSILHGLPLKRDLRYSLCTTPSHAGCLFCFQHSLCQHDLATGRGQCGLGTGFGRMRYYPLDDFSTNKAFGLGMCGIKLNGILRIFAGERTTWRAVGSPSLCPPPSFCSRREDKAGSVCPYRKFGRRKAQGIPPSKLGLLGYKTHLCNLIKLRATSTD